jgi:hypothetical protein
MPQQASPLHRSLGLPHETRRHNKVLKNQHLTP